MGNAIYLIRKMDTYKSNFSFILAMQVLNRYTRKKKQTKI